MFELKDVYASYGEGMVLRHVSLEAPKGRVTCLVGRNGAGKTTTLKSVMGLVKTPQGKILLDDKEIQDLPVYERAKKGIGYVPQGREIFPQLTVEENILLGLEAKKGKGGIPDFIYETFPILNEFRKRKGGDLSGGQQQQLAIARAVAAEPALLILDEPTEGIQPSVIQEIGRVITELKSRMAVLIVEQYLEFVMEIADYCYVMENGRIIMDGEPEELDQEKLHCGTAWDRAETLVVPDVDAFPGHIACSSLSRSEIVVPLKREDGEVWGVLDIDSDDLGSFDETDARFLEEMIKML